MPVPKMPDAKETVTPAPATYGLDYEYEEESGIATPGWNLF
jgi:hypothetical protein